MPGREVPHRRPLAIDDIAGHSKYIAESNLDSTLHVLDAIEATVDKLCQCPEAGGAVPTTRPEAEEFRAKLVNCFGNYVGLYFVTAEAIDIARHPRWAAVRADRLQRRPRLKVKHRSIHFRDTTN